MRQWVLMRSTTKYHHPNQQRAQVCACEEKETLPLGQHKLKKHKFHRRRDFLVRKTSTNLAMIFSADCRN